MTDIIIQGIGGRMGHVLCEMIAQREDCRIIAGIDVKDGEQNGIPVYDTYNRNYMNRDLMSYFGEERFRSLYPEDFFSAPAATLPVWHLVGGRDPLCRNETGRSDPRDGYPVLLDDWITEDGLKCLKVKLRGNDPE